MACARCPGVPVRGACRSQDHHWWRSLPVNRDAGVFHVGRSEPRLLPGRSLVLGAMSCAVRPFINRSYRTKTDAKSTLDSWIVTRQTVFVLPAATRPGSLAMRAACRRRFGRDSTLCSEAAIPADRCPVLRSSRRYKPRSKPRAAASLVDWGLVRTGGTHNSVIEEAATRRGKEMVGLLQSSFGYKEGSDLFLAGRSGWASTADHLESSLSPMLGRCCSDSGQRRHHVSTCGAAGG